MGLEAANNPLLTKLIFELTPSVRRLQYLSLYSQGRRLKDNLKYFQELTRYVKLKNAEMGVKKIREYVENELIFVQKALQSFK